MIFSSKRIAGRNSYRSNFKQANSKAASSPKELKKYLSKLPDHTLYAYNVYQIEGEGRNLFSNIDGDEDTIMGLPIKKIKEYLANYK